MSAMSLVIRSRQTSFQMVSNYRKSLVRKKWSKKKIWKNYGGESKTVRPWGGLCLRVSLRKTLFSFTLKTWRRRTRVSGWGENALVELGPLWSGVSLFFWAFFGPGKSCRKCRDGTCVIRPIVKPAAWTKTTRQNRKFERLLKLD
jgi:hypothetical protein